MRDQKTTPDWMTRWIRYQIRCHLRAGKICSAVFYIKKAAKRKGIRVSLFEASGIAGQFQDSLDPK